MRTITILCVLLLVGCQAKDTEKARDKTTAEKAFDAADRAKKKAEQIKKEQDKKARETDEAGNQ
jgi:hypothetical protein